MRNIFLFGMLLLAINAFGQEPLTKDQEKKLKTIQKETTKQLNSIVDNAEMTQGEKKSRIQLLKNERDSKLADFMASTQVSQALSKDPVKWSKAEKQIDKNEVARLKNEKKNRLAEISSQQKLLEKQESDIEKQLKDLKAKQADIKQQQKNLKNKEKSVKSEYN